MIPLGVRNTPLIPVIDAPGDSPEKALAGLVRQDGWSYEIEFTGTRARASVEGGVARLVSRTGLDLSRQHPAVMAALERTFVGKDVLLDGICPQEPASFMAFDLLYDGDDRRAKPYAVRAVLLDGIGERMVDDGQGRLFRAVRSSDGEKLWATTQEYGMPGLIAKQVTAPYSGRTAWLKITQAREDARDG